MNRCVMCNEIIPEGRQVCPNCENATVKRIEEVSKLAELLYNECDTVLYLESKEIARFLIKKGYCNKTELAREIFKEIRKEIELALESNYKARQEHLEKWKNPNAYIGGNFVDTVDGKILALRGIDDFIDEIEKKYIGE